MKQSDLNEIRIRDWKILDVRFPTSVSLDGSDAMHPDPDYSAAYVVLRTNREGLEGHGLTFTLGRGTELCAAAADVLCRKLTDAKLGWIVENFAGLWRSMTCDAQLRWIGPEKGVVHLATAAVVNALWDLYAKAVEKPLWQLVTDMTPEELVGVIDFRYLSDVLTPDDALAILRKNEPTKQDRAKELAKAGFPAYTTSAGWLGYPDEKIVRLCREGIAAGWNHFKLKVGGNAEDDRRRAALVRKEIGPNRKLMIDANQRWDVDEAIEQIHRLAEFDLWWVEEPTSPDDILGHAKIARAVAPIGIATGEQCQNRVIFKQLLQMDAIKFCQIDSCRLGGVNEVLAVMLLAKKFGIPVCPHAGGVGLCEYVNHLIMIDYTRIGASFESRVAEYVDHLHEHFEDPVVIRDARYMPPTAAGYGITMKPESLKEYRYPDGPVWQALGHGTIRSYV
jgi:L-fuconate dehydratase